MSRRNNTAQKQTNEQKKTNEQNDFFFKLGFTLCKAEQPLWGMELQEKEAQKDYSI